MELSRSHFCPFIIFWITALPFADKLYITHIEHSFNGDAWFPKMDMQPWKRQHCESRAPDEQNKYAHQFEIYERGEPEQ